MTLAHMDFQAANGSSILGGNALETIGTATSIRTDAAGEVTVTDGPFAETKEALGGYYLIEAADLDEAIAIAKQVPAPFGGVEVRPIMDIRLIVTVAGRGRRRDRGRAPPRVGLRARRDGARHPRHRPGRGVRAGRLQPGADDLGRAGRARPSPAAWLTTVARRRALDLLRREQTPAAQAAAAARSRRPGDGRACQARPTRSPTTGCG